MANLVKTETYVKSDPVNNNNKFWIIEMYDDHSIITRWGRVGDDGDSKTYPFPSETAAQKFWDKKVDEKTRDGRNDEIAYKKADVVGKPGAVNVKSSSSDALSKGDLQRVALKQISSDNKETEDLIRRLAKANVHNILSSTTMSYNVESGLFSTPIGIVSQATIDEANKLLVRIVDGVIAQQYDEPSFGRLVGDYLMLIPQNIGRRFNLRQIFPDVATVQQQKAILDSLEASLDQVLSGGTQNKPKAEEKTAFAVKLTSISDRQEIIRIEKKFLSTLHKNHTCSHLRPKRVWKVEIESMSQAFDLHGRKIGNINEYYHGSRVSNILSILSKGMIIVPNTSPHVCGRMFSDGLYFSSESTKSLAYSYGYWHNFKDNNCFMFMVDVAMGRYYVPRNPNERPLPPKGYDSVWAKAGESGVHNHEMIVYHTYQANPTRLIEFE